MNAMKATTNTLISWINLLHMFGNHYTYVLGDILHQAEEDLVGIKTLLEGFLPPQFIPPELLQETLLKISEQLIPYGTFQLAHPELGYYYHLQDVTFTRIGTSVIIKIRIPLTVLSNTFDVYQMHSVPIPLAPGRPDFSVIDFEKPYLAISKDERFFLALSQAEYAFCKGDSFKICEQIFLIQESTTPNCPLAMYFGNTVKISELCKSSYATLKNTKTHIIGIEQNKFLMSTTDSNWIRSCPLKTPMKITPCQFCIISLPCACSLKGDTFFLPPSISNCDNTTEVKTKHSVNLPALYEFYQDYKSIYNITIHQTYSYPVMAQIPKIRVIDSKFDHVVDREKVVSLSLSKIALNVKNDEKIFSDKASQLQDDLGWLTSTFVNKAIVIICFISFILADVSLFLAVRNYYKLLVLVKPV